MMGDKNKVAFGWHPLGDATLAWVNRKSDMPNSFQGCRVCGAGSRSVRPLVLWYQELSRTDNQSPWWESFERALFSLRDLWHPLVRAMVVSGIWDTSPIVETEVSSLFEHSSYY